MRIRTACLDGEQLWAVDDVIGGLYSINQRTYETECVIDCRQLFPDGRFEVLSLFQWKEDYIVLVPREIERNWIFYNKVTGETEYRKVMDRKYQEVLVGADQDRGQLYFLPIYVKDPVLIVDLRTLTYVRIIENWSGKKPDDCRVTAWKRAYDGEYIFSALYNTKTLMRLSCDSPKVDLLKLDIPENLIDVNYGFEELWALPMRGDKIYQIDKNGGVVNTVELSAEDVINPLPDFARIIVQKRYLFLLPYYRKGIYVYDKWNGEMHIIPEEGVVLAKKNKEIYLRYWEYCIRGNLICFLPFRDKYIEIDLDTLAYEIRELSYPDLWSDEEKIWRVFLSQISERDLLVGESEECGLKILLKYMQQKINEKAISVNDSTGKMVWDMLKS